ncbi:hypothetical protein CANCADRAFT_31084 [Tortispora caseinolytica NRRL Y-17796]|uniref:Uncharacterized protein n=1 Tax=Tortispora caseinolytica NRRL Y-17796 TaxID=767744 RepID=A0A1E4TDY8_9ASCO|nr:hypothetical protein CANCADRAFT_31084 [Tortispora caseinolytica NRRL Y-17796]
MSRPFYGQGAAVPSNPNLGIAYAPFPSTSNARPIVHVPPQRLHNEHLTDPLAMPTIPVTGPGPNAPGVPAEVLNNNRTHGPVVYPVRPESGQSRLLRLAELLSIVRPQSDASRMEYWSHVTNEFFSKFSRVRITFVHHNPAERRLFEVPYLLLPATLYSLYNTSIVKTHIFFESVQEARMPTGTVFLESKSALIIQNYADGLCLQCRGPLRVLFSANMKIEWIEFLAAEISESYTRARVLSMLDAGETDMLKDYTDLGIPNVFLKRLETVEAMSTLRELIYLDHRIRDRKGTQEPISPFDIMRDFANGDPEIVDLLHVFRSQPVSVIPVPNTNTKNTGPIGGGVPRSAMGPGTPMSQHSAEPSPINNTSVKPAGRGGNRTISGRGGRGAAKQGRGRSVSEGRKVSKVKRRNSEQNDTVSPAAPTGHGSPYLIESASFKSPEEK